MSPSQGGSPSRASTHRAQGLSMTSFPVSPPIQNIKQNQDLATFSSPVSLSSVFPSVSTYTTQNPENPEIIPLTLPSPAPTTTIPIINPPALSPTFPPKAPSSFRIVFQNINGLPIRSSNPKLDSIQAFINAHQVDVMGLSELNSAWHLIPTASRLPALTAKWFESCHLGLAWNTTEKPLSPCQVGGVALLSTNQLAHWVISSGSDPTNLG